MRSRSNAYMLPDRGESREIHPTARKRNWSNIRAHLTLVYGSVGFVLRWRIIVLRSMVEPVHAAGTPVYTHGRTNARGNVVMFDMLVCNLLICKIWHGAVFCVIAHVPLRVHWALGT